ncbi:MAG: retroviral-like aspartic protease family protein [Phycisphaerae bacterium]|nr:retroviral-like aspartic protease family protein [Phycisphaerae bacterium]
MRTKMGRRFLATATAAAWALVAALAAWTVAAAADAGPGSFVAAGSQPAATAEGDSSSPAAGQASRTLATRRARPEKTVLHHPVAIPMRLTSGIPEVEVGNNGRGPFRFILDTGASTLTVSRDLADRLALPIVTGTRITSVSPVASMDLGHPRTVRELRLGSAVFQNTDAAAADLSSLQMGKLDGILGISVFADCRLTLDYPAKRIVLEPLQTPTPPAQPGEVLPTRPLGLYLLTVPVKVQDQTLWCLVDSGSNGWLTVPQAQADALPVSAMATNETPSHMFGGKQASMKLARLSSSVYLGRWELPRPIIDIADHNQLILGGGVLGHFVVTIDSQAQTIRLARRVGQPIPSPPPLKTLGVKLHRQGQAWIVTGPQRGVDLDALGLKVADKILRIERQAVADLSRGGLEAMMRDHDALQLDLERNGRRLSLRLPLTVLIP